MKKNLQDLTDEELLIKLSEGEYKALDHLYLRHSGRILSYAHRRGLPTERAEDLLQIVFMQLHRKKHLYDPRHSALAWIYVITRSELKDYRNREIKDFAEWDDSLSQTDGAAPILETKDEAQALLNELKPREQEVMKLRYLDELEYNEIAEILKESESNIRQIVSRSLRLLRNRLAPGRAAEPQARKLKQKEE
ncbi:RNA polymerase sigma factor [Bdellovibrio sp. HCB-162]|uniref:RNA polymerase sigma factor n=1 Tax=Bdellovibrio sp. HCB-162 TaxID=3394234 RepID=UPI0039BD7C0D